MGQEPTSETHFKNTGVRFINSTIELSETGNTYFGSLAQKAMWAYYRQFEGQKPTIQEQFEFFTNFKNQLA